MTLDYKISLEHYTFIDFATVGTNELANILELYVEKYLDVCVWEHSEASKAWAGVGEYNS